VKEIQYRIAIFLSLFLALSGIVGAQEIQLSRQEIIRIGEKVFENECASKDECLVEWNDGESFLSLGIGHFIWYPENSDRSFEESFPKFLDYAKSLGEKIPEWLNKDLYLFCPWNSREEFLRSQGDRRLLELREFLITTKPLQAAFMVKRLQDALPVMLKSVSGERRATILQQFNRVASVPSGVYALVDYANFKGLGILSSERYKGKSWGLLQVLSEMRDETEAPNVLEEFVRAAEKVLIERVNNSPQGRNEQKWLPGWQKRINSYLNQ
jgi:hypothetical protein